MRWQAIGWRSCGRWAIPLAGVFGATISATQVSASPTASKTGATIGLVLTDWRYALVETSGAKEECPDGLQVSEVEQFKAAAPDPAGRLKKFGLTWAVRGPNAENSNYNPLSVTDPLPWRELKTTRGYGVNLDGTPDGHATPTTCAHEKFTSDDGERIDNQMARVLGCVQGWRTSGFSAERASADIVTSPVKLLIEISRVTDEQNDPDVDVTIYKGRDRLVREADGTTFVPFMSHRIDTRFPQFTLKAHGRIIDGVLMTDAIPVARVAQRGSERDFRDLTLRLKLGPNGAEGIIAGYESVATWWNAQSKGVAADISKFSPAGLYRALHRYADGYPDPATGECTGISVAFKIRAVRALIAHPAKDKLPSRLAMRGNE
jgi:hypothetical protein